MSRSRTPTQDMEAIAKQLAKNRSPAERPERLPLGKIRLWPSVFQHRNPQGYEGKKHIDGMAEAVKRNPALGLHPITVWWDGRAWACLDGHHRHAAYQQAGVGAAYLVPVAVFEGSLDQAIGQAAEGNTRNKLSMTPSEKSNAAWRLVAHTQLSKTQVVAVTGVSDSQVAIMRRTFKTLVAREDSMGFAEVGLNFRDMRWLDARRYAEGKGAPDFDRETADEKKAQAMAKALRAALGTQGAQFPHVMARALEICDSRLPETLAEWWGTADDEATETATEDF
jgi:hypothetical protein